MKPADVQPSNQPPALPARHPDAASFGKTGILLVNLGTPDGTDYWSIRRYLKEFLSDPRVIEVPKVVWWFILNLIILTFRPKKTGHAYAQIWDKARNASPLRVITEDQTTALQARFPDMVVGYGMRYGNPSLATAMDSMKAKGVTRLLVAPLYPQYSAATTATVVDKISDWMRTQRWQPTLRYLPPYYDHPAYIGALAMSLKEHIAGMSVKPDVIVTSFHGLPLVNCQKGDTYYCHSHKTARLLAEALGSAFVKTADELDGRVAKGETLRKPKDMPPVLLVFQSRFGAQEWLKPYFAVTIEELAAKGIKNVLMVCPGFSADCVETLEEIGIGGKEAFLEAGGESYEVVPCLNASELGMDMLEGIVEMELMGWRED